MAGQSYSGGVELGHMPAAGSAYILFGRLQ
ncbi:hypothetical protein B14911_22342 [Bacillus sp. NRRL B-14911]|nr:hypothetical protein B14911_22342 [Bacillus sp. NRRL B-14911]